MELKQGDAVQVARPDDYTKAFSSRVRDRAAVVVKVWTPLGGTSPKVRVRFGKRGGRGKEFEEIFPMAALVKVADA